MALSLGLGMEARIGSTVGTARWCIARDGVRAARDGPGAPGWARDGPIEWLAADAQQRRDSTAVDFVTMMALEPHGTDVWVGAGPRYPWGGLFGGQIVAQALRAATFTVDGSYRVHSLHAYFIRPGDHTEPIRFEVDRVRNGRSFCTRRGRHASRWA